jgi:type 1 glutamine amidotransferase/sugar phosphate isomerase/epimerase
VVFVVLVLLAGALVFPAPAQNPAWQVVGWRVGVESSSFGPATIFETIEKTAAAGARNMEGNAGQKVSDGIARNFDWNLADADIAAVRQKLRASGVAMPSYYTRNIPADEQGMRRLFQFARSLAIETIVSQPASGQLPAIDQLAGEFGINVALLNHARGASPVYSDPKAEMQALAGRSKRLGVCADTGAWSQDNIRPLDALAVVKDRLITLHLADRNRLGSGGSDVVLGTGAAGLGPFLREVNRLGIKPTELAVAYAGGTPEQIAQSVSFLDRMVIVALGDTLDKESKTAATRFNVTGEEQQKIEAAVPKTALAKPRKARRLLVVDLQAGYGGHHSLPHSNTAIEAMGRQTGAYEPMFNNDLANLRYDKLRQYDALYLVNTVGPILNAQEIREGLLRYMREGGGLIGHHGTGRTSLDWPEFAEMLGSYAGPHTVSNEKVTITVDDANSPLTRDVKEKSFPWTDEFFRFPSPPYSRDKLHILLTMTPDAPQNCAGCSRADGDYAVSWIRNYGKGRVFYSVLGHTAADFWEPWILRHFLAGIQFALGDLDADASPSAVRP